MDGAVQSGERAAREVLHAMGKITKEEINQQEPPSKDVPPVSCEMSLYKRWLPPVPVYKFVVQAVGIIGFFLYMRYFARKN